MKRPFNLGSSSGRPTPERSAIARFHLHTNIDMFHLATPKHQVSFNLFPWCKNFSDLEVCDIIMLLNARLNFASLIRLADFSLFFLFLLSSYLYFPNSEYGKPVGGIGCYLHKIKSSALAILTASSRHDFNISPSDPITRTSRARICRFLEYNYGY